MLRVAALSHAIAALRVRAAAQLRDASVSGALHALVRRPESNDSVECIQLRSERSARLDAFQ